MAEVSFGEWLKRRRKARGLTQEELALQISCSASALRKIEAEQRRPSAQIVEQLAEAFNVAPSERKSFLKFARGNWAAAPTEVNENTPWLFSFSPEREPKTHLATFLFTDIEGSTKLWENVPEKMKSALQRHHEILQEAISSNGGNAFQIVGDAFCAAFPTASSAISAALAAQQNLHQEQWDLPSPIRVRMGIHTGAAERASNDSLTGGYASNHTLNRVARILSAGHGGQILLSRATKELIRDSLPADAELRDMGEHHLKNLTRPEHLFQVNSAGLPLDFLPLNTLDPTRHNLLLQLTSFIGRVREMAEVKYLLSATRLLTLIGPGGIGKTRLSIQVANELLDQYPDGAWFVELAPISDPLLLPRATAIAIGLRDEPQRPVIDMLCDYLRGKQLLLILDNCEHLVEACAQLADRLLHACPKIHILASSREAVGIAGETSYLVPSLELPDMQNLPTAMVLSQCEAIRLFIERASAATQNFRVTDENAPSIAQICHRLDGIPLAIELAAGKTRALSTQQISQRLDDRFHLLTGGSRTALPRHQTLRAAIEWSYNLLSANEQILFRRLSVFVNDWTLEATESVCSDKDTTAGDALKTQDILELLTQLVNKSLVMTEERNGEVRCHLLETIQQFANEKLVEVNESESFHDRHLGYFLQLAETAEPHLIRSEQLEWLARLDSENENLRAALTWSVGKDSAELALRLAGSLGWFWDYRNYWLEGTKWLQGALSKERDIADELEKGARAKALLRIADLLLELDDLDEARNSIEESLAIYKDIGDEHGQVFAQASFGYALRRQGDYARAQSLLEQSRGTFRRLNDTWGQAYAISALATIYQNTNNHNMYKKTVEENLKLIRASGDRYLISNLLNGYANWLFYNNEMDQAEDFENEAEHLLDELQAVTAGYPRVWTKARMAYVRGDHERAKELCIKVSMQYELLGEKNTRALALWLLGYIAMDNGDIEGAVSNLENAREIAGTILVKEGHAFLLAALGQAYYFHGNHAEALDHFKQSLGLLEEVGEKTEMTIATLNHIASVAVSGQSETTVQLLGAADTFARPIKPIEPIFQYHHDRVKEKAHSQLGEMAFISAWERGQKMSIDEALDLALKTVEEI